MADYKYDNPDEIYEEAQRRIKEAKGGLLRGSATKLDLSEWG